MRHFFAFDASLWYECTVLEPFWYCRDIYMTTHTNKGNISLKQINLHRTEENLRKKCWGRNFASAYHNSSVMPECSPQTQRAWKHNPLSYHQHHRAESLHPQYPMSWAPPSPPWSDTYLLWIICSQDPICKTSYNFLNYLSRGINGR